MSYFVHPQAICESAVIGDGTRIWAFAHVLPGARIGVDCNICDSVFIENDVTVGDATTVKCGVQLWDGVRLGDHVFVGPNATFTNDRFPRSKQHPEEYATTVVADGASIGANATVLPGLTIGAAAMVGAGSVVTRSVPPRAIVKGSPARITGYVDAVSRPEAYGAADRIAGASVVQTSIEGVAVHRMKTATDMRGSLAACEFGEEIPFEAKRVFFVYDVPSKDVRGEHAHHRCEQFLVCVQGSVAVVVDNGRDREEIFLDRPDVGILIPPMVWGAQYKYSADAVLAVFASEHYDAEDYIRNYDDYLGLVGS